MVIDWPALLSIKPAISNLKFTSHMYTVIQCFLLNFYAKVFTSAIFVSQVRNEPLKTSSLESQFSREGFSDSLKLVTI